MPLRSIAPSTIRASRLLLGILLTSLSARPALAEDLRERFVQGVHLSTQAMLDAAALGGVPAAQLMDLVLVDLASRGLDLVAIQNAQALEPELMGAMGTTADRLGQRLWANVEVPPWTYREPELLEGQRALAEREIRALLDPRARTPGLVAWSLKDEPSGPQVASIRSLAAWVESTIDPDHPSIFITFRPQEAGPLVGSAGIVALDHYPIRTATRAPLEVAQAVTIAHGTLPENAQLWFSVQTHGFLPNGTVPPSRAELRLMSQASVAAGARGLLYFLYSAPSPWRIPALSAGLATSTLTPRDLADEAAEASATLAAIGALAVIATPQGDVFEVDTGLLAGGPRPRAGILNGPGDRWDLLVVLNPSSEQPLDAVVPVGALGDRQLHRIVVDASGELRLGQPDAPPARASLAPGAASHHLIADARTLPELEKHMRVGLARWAALRLAATVEYATHLERDVDGARALLTRARRTPEAVGLDRELITARSRLEVDLGRHTAHHALGAALERSGRALAEADRWLVALRGLDLGSVDGAAVLGESLVSEAHDLTVRQIRARLAWFQGRHTGLAREIRDLEGAAGNLSARLRGVLRDASS